MFRKKSYMFILLFLLFITIFIAPKVLRGLIGALFVIYGASFGFRSGFLAALYSTLLIGFYYLANPQKFTLGPYMGGVAGYFITGTVLGWIIENHKKRSKEYILKEYAINSAINAIAIADLEGYLIDVNSSFLRMWGYNSKEEVVGKHVKEFWQDEERALEVKDTLVYEKNWFGELIARKKDGTFFYTQLSANLVVDSDKKPLCMMASFIDITERKKTEEALKKSESLFRLLAENARDIIFRFTLNPDFKFDYVSPAVKKITGYDPQHFYDNPNLVFRLISPYHRPLFEKVIRGCYDYSNPFLLKVSRQDDKNVWIEHHVVPIYDENDELIAIEGIGRDVTERKEMERQLEFLSLYDSLTGLHNRSFFERKMEQYDIENLTFGIIVCDVDGLKIINDTLGHDAGDAQLILAASIIKNCCTKEDIVARVGGDEFAVIICDCDPLDVEKTCKKIYDAVEAYNEENSGLPLSISVGHAVRNSNYVTAKEIFKEADNNMYREKMHRKRRTRSAILKTLKKALINKDYVTEGHTERLQKLVTDVAVVLGLSQRRIGDLQLFAQFHDIGKVGISDRILFKPGPLNLDEKKEMQRHCEIGQRIALSAPELAHIADWILKHHEWWNGEGYPLGLQGEDIPIECRIFAVADAYDAMTSYRPYRNTMSHEEAIAELKSCSGTQFDPNILEVFLEVLSKRRL